MMIQENYPDLKSNQNFLALQSQLEGTENRIAIARRDYNEAVRDYNTTLRTFPQMIWAKTMYASSKPMQLFTASTLGPGGAHASASTRPPPPPPAGPAARQPAAGRRSDDDPPRPAPARGRARARCVPVVRRPSRWRARRSRPHRSSRR